MRRKVDHAAMAVAGFVAPWSVAPGEKPLVHLSGADPAPDLRIRRLDRDAIPPVDWPVLPLAPVQVGAIALGSWIGLPLPRGDIDLRFELKLTRNPDPRPLLALGPQAIEVSDDAPMRFGPALSPDPPLPRNRWLTVRLLLAATEVSVSVLDAGRPIASVAGTLTTRPERIEIGGDAGETRPTLNACLGRLGMTGGFGTRDWRFPWRGPVAEVPAIGGGRALGLHNLPTFAATSPRWDGSGFDPRLVPEHYDAIHLHDDDFGGLDWPATHAVAVPPDAPAGVYAVEIVSGGVVERLPFFVRAAEAASRLVFLAPTATYLAYADEALPEDRFPALCRDRGHDFARANGLTSPYDLHSDGSGVTVTTARRPRATLRDDYRYPLSGTPHLLPVDLRLLAFAAREGIALDLLTDHDLDALGPEALRPYAGVVTGSHPEYWSDRMLSALEGYLDSGGSLACLGGNGFDTVVAFAGEVMELRRGRAPSHRTWDPAPGEWHLSLTGEPGGPWRERGRGEFHLTGIGLSLMGFGPSRPFRRTDESTAPDLAWLFEGVEGPEFGTGGIVGGAAAGYEVDATNPRLGTPEGTRILAVATGFGPDFIDDAGRWFLDEGERAGRRVAEVCLRAHPGGGIVFAAGSVAWCGALPGPGAANALGRITRNLLAALGARPA